MQHTDIGPTSAQSQQILGRHRLNLSKSWADIGSILANPGPISAQSQQILGRHRLNLSKSWADIG
jgi:hypothetical protein